MRNSNQLLNCEKGKRCFILANGPSLREHNLALLKKELVIGMNASTILEKEYYFFQKYYVLSDLRFLNNPLKRRIATSDLSPETVRILRSDLYDYDDKSLKNITYYVKSIGRDGFSDNISKGFYFGCSTTLLAIQLAATLGCDNIYILGLDLSNYINSKIRFYQEDIVQEYDLYISTQIFNICKAYNELCKKNIKIYHCNKKSLISPYLPFCCYDHLF